MTQPKHKIDDWVRITKNRMGHGYEIGQEVEILGYRYNNYIGQEGWIFNDDDCEAIDESNPDPTQLKTMLSELKAMVEKIEQTVLEGKL